VKLITQKLLMLSASLKSRESAVGTAGQKPSAKARVHIFTATQAISGLAPDGKRANKFISTLEQRKLGRVLAPKRKMFGGRFLTCRAP
jgi:hypothetical protein